MRRLTATRIDWIFSASLVRTLLLAAVLIYVLFAKEKNITDAGLTLQYGR